MIQIENKEGVENLEKMLSQNKIDAVMIGPYDLSGSLGVLVILKMILLQIVA